MPNGDVVRSGFIPNGTFIGGKRVSARFRRGRLTIDLDSTEFMSKFHLFAFEMIPDRIKKGLAKAGEALMVDTIQEIPLTPILTSALISSGAVFVDMKKVADSSKWAWRSGKSLATARVTSEDYQPDTAEAQNKGMVADIVFNAPYAAVQHESFPTKSYPGAGIKYMEKKLVGNADRYMSIIAAEMARP